MPLLLPEGTFFGTLCGVDPEPRQLTRQQAELLVVLARLLATQLGRDRAETALRATETELRAANARLAELDRLRGEFLAAISHDLRTPLTAARTALRLVALSAGERLRPDERDLLDNGRRNTERLGRLIDDLLALNQLTAGTLRLAREPLDLREIAADAAAAVEPLVRDKGQALALELPEPLPGEGDPRLLEQALVNLLANAHRHTPPGTRIAIGGRVDGDEPCLVVRDDGPGIPPDEHEAIFRRFHRLGQSAEGADGGQGLGLAIARGIVELHRGRIWVESTPGQGAAFHVALPGRRG